MNTMPFRYRLVLVAFHDRASASSIFVRHIFNRSRNMNGGRIHGSPRLGLHSSALLCVVHGQEYGVTSATMATTPPPAEAYRRKNFFLSCLTSAADVIRSSLGTVRFSLR
jgi:hypothetical protein